MTTMVDHKRQPLQDYLEARMFIEPNSGCWLWNRAADQYGYGTFQYDYVKWRAHRASFRVWHGEIPDGLYVLHKCDTPSCVNPKHLFLGTQADNMRDAASKGRNAMQRHPERNRITEFRGDFRGDTHARTKVSDANVAEMRRLYASGVSVRKLGPMFGVHHATVSKIVAGKSRQAAIDEALK